MELGLTQHAEHASWLQNILDRQALRAICTVGGALHNADLDHLIKAHFKEVLQQLNDQDGAKDCDPQEDEKMA